MNGENDFTKGKATEAYVNYFKENKSLPISSQLKEMVYKSLHGGMSPNEVKDSISNAIDKAEMLPYELAMAIIDLQKND